MIEIKTLEVCSLMPETVDTWFMSTQTNRDYIIQVSEKPCRECDCTEYVRDKFGSYCNHCGLIRERESFIQDTEYNGFTHDMKVLKNRSSHLKTIETQIKKIEPNYNKKYRDFKNYYYDLFLEIAMKEYYIPNGTANDLFYLYFRGFYDLNSSQGLLRKKLIRRFLDRISINPREYFMMGQSVNTEDNKALDKKLMSGSRIPVISEGQLNVTGKKFTGRKIGYQTYLEVNQFTDTSAILMKYIKRYCTEYTLLNIKYSFTPEDYNRDSVAQPVTTIPTLNDDYIPFNSLGLEDMIINTVQYPSRSKYQGLDSMKDSMVQELKKRQPYYSTNLNTYIYTNKPEKKPVEPKTENDPQKNTKNKSEIKTINGTIMTKRMNEEPYKNKIYHKNIGKRRHCHNCGQIFITTKHRQLYCSHCKQ